MSQAPNRRGAALWRGAAAGLSAFARRVRRADWTPLLLIWAAGVFYIALCALLDISALGASGYNTYTLQALAWRRGALSLGVDHPHLELAVFQNDWYVSFPPVPSVPLYFLTFLFGANTPDHLLVKLYVLFGTLFAYRMLRGAGYDKAGAAGFSLLCGFASALLSLTTNGAVWYQAQTLAFLLAMGACCLMTADKPAGALLLYALSVGCRPFNALYALPLFALYVRRFTQKGEPPLRALKRLIPGLALGFSVAFALGAYNFARFGDVFEFGHNYLPEFSWQGGVQFSLAHVAKNARTFLLGAPFYKTPEGWTLNQFGFSLFLANPALLLLPVWMATDILRRRFTWTKAAVALAVAAHLFLLLLHRTFGGYQFGARYACDLLPYAALYLALPGRRRTMTVPEALLLFAALAFCVYGACVIRL